MLLVCTRRQRQYADTNIHADATIHRQYIDNTTTIPRRDNTPTTHRATQSSLASLRSINPINCSVHSSSAAAACMHEGTRRRVQRGPRGIWASWMCSPCPLLFSPSARFHVLTLAARRAQTRRRCGPSQLQRQCSVTQTARPCVQAFLASVSGGQPQAT